MEQTDRRLETSLDTSAQAILPSLAMLIEDVREAAMLARPGFDMENYAAELRAIARQIGALTELVAAVTPQAADSRERMSA